MLRELPLVMFSQTVASWAQSAVRVFSRGRLDRAQFLAQRGARCGRGVREIDDLDPDRLEVPVQPLYLLGAAPVVAFEKDVEPKRAGQISSLSAVIAGNARST
jgi:hypothetical protein